MKIKDGETRCRTWPYALWEAAGRPNGRELEHRALANGAERVFRTGDGIAAGNRRSRRRRGPQCIEPDGVGLARRVGRWAGFAILALSIAGGSALAQNAKPAEMSPATAAMRRFPQPVRAGDLIGRSVLQPTESRSVLGRVTQIVQSSEGAVQVVVTYGGLFGIGARPIAVPLDAMALLGTDLEILDFTPDQLDAFPTFDVSRITPVAPGSTIRVGLARPSH